MNREIKGHMYDLKEIFGVEITRSKMKRLAEIEVEGHKLAEDYCNGVIETDEHTKLESALLKEASSILCDTQGILISNSDPRGYFLKIDDVFMRTYRDFELETDWGGYGIVCPNFVTERLVLNE